MGFNRSGTGYCQSCGKPIKAPKTLTCGDPECVLARDRKFSEKLNRRCEVCGISFQTWTPTRRYCSDPCRLKAGVVIRRKGLAKLPL